MRRVIGALVLFWLMGGCSSPSMPKAQGTTPAETPTIQTGWLPLTVADADTDADSDSDADTDTDADSDADSDADADSDSDSDADSDADSDTDTECDTDVTCEDHDHDGYTTCDGDCDDHDKDVHPGCTEIPCNGKDDDCNARTPDRDGTCVTDTSMVTDTATVVTDTGTRPCVPTWNVYWTPTARTDGINLTYAENGGLTINSQVRDTEPGRIDELIAVVYLCDLDGDNKAAVNGWYNNAPEAWNPTGTWYPCAFHGAPPNERMVYYGTFSVDDLRDADPKANVSLADALEIYGVDVNGDGDFEGKDNDQVGCKLDFDRVP